MISRKNNKKNYETMSHFIVTMNANVDSFITKLAISMEVYELTFMVFYSDFIKISIVVGGFFGALG